MRWMAVLLGVGFSVLVLMFAAPGSPSRAIGTFGLLASLAMIIHPRAGFIAFFAPLGLSLLGMANIERSYVIYVIPYAVLTLLAFRVVEDRKARKQEYILAAERAERADRYIRQQLGE